MASGSDCSWFKLIMKYDSLRWNNNCEGIGKKQAREEIRIELEDLGIFQTDKQILRKIQNLKHKVKTMDEPARTVEDTIFLNWITEGDLNSLHFSILPEIIPPDFELSIPKIEGAISSFDIKDEVVESETPIQTASEHYSMNLIQSAPLEEFKSKRLKIDNDLENIIGSFTLENRSKIEEDIENIINQISNTAEHSEVLHSTIPTLQHGAPQSLALESDSIVITQNGLSNTLISSPVNHQEHVNEGSEPVITDLAHELIVLEKGKLVLETEKLALEKDKLALEKEKLALEISELKKRAVVTKESSTQCD